MSQYQIKADLGPTNTGKTHRAINRMLQFRSGVIGLPLRLLAREVYDKLCAQVNPQEVALITGEERIVGPRARYWVATVEAMPRDFSAEIVIIDEVQLAADLERGHVFTDRILNTRGTKETLLLGSHAMRPLLQRLFPEAHFETSERFSTLSWAGRKKLASLPQRSAIVAFSTDEVYATAEFLRRQHGGAAVVMGALSPQTRNRQVELFQSGEVDYIVATDAIGMGLNLDVHHVAFAALTKFDGVRQRRLMPAEMAQIAGRAGRHQTDGSFGTLSGNRRGAPLELSEDEVYAIENHQFAPVPKLYWREPDPRFDTLEVLIGDLEAHPRTEGLTRAPEAIDLAVLKRLSEQSDVAVDITSSGLVRRFWEACQLPDFRQQGADAHARFVARLWRDLKGGHIGADFVAARISELDHTSGDIDTLQGRLAAIRSWAYICQRPDWVLARDEMAARARAAEAKLSDALHQKITERFVNRRTSVLMKGMGKDAGLLRVELADDGQVTVEGESIGHLEGFRFVVDAEATTEERKLMLAAAEKHMASLLAAKSQKLVADELGELRIERGQVMSGDQSVATLEEGKSASRPRLVMAKELGQMDPAHRARLQDALDHWLETQLTPLAALRALEDAALDTNAGTEVRALLLTLAARNGTTRREDAGLAHVPKEKRPFLRRLGVTIGSLDVFVPALLKPAPRKLLRDLGLDRRPVRDAMEAVIEGGDQAPAGYRRAGKQAIRIDMAEKLFRAAHERRARAPQSKEVRGFPVDTALATSMGLLAESFRSLMKDAGFRPGEAVALAEGAAGPPRPIPWTWRAPRKDFAANRSFDRRPAHAKQAGKGGGKGRPGGTPPHKGGPRGAPQPKGDGGAAFAGLADLLGKK